MTNPGKLLQDQANIDLLRARVEAAERDAKDWLHAYKAASRDLSEAEATLAAVLPQDRDRLRKWLRLLERGELVTLDSLDLSAIRHLANAILDGEGESE